MPRRFRWDPASNIRVIVEHDVQTKPLERQPEITRAQHLIALRQETALKSKGKHGAYANLLFELGKKEQALEELRTGFLKHGNPQLFPLRLRLYNWALGASAAPEEYAEPFEAARDIGELTALFNIVPDTTRSERRFTSWRAIERRLDALSTSKTLGEVQRIATLRLQLKLALRDYDSFLRLFATGSRPFRHLEWQFGRVAEVLQARAFPDFEAPKIFGIGLSKTGTVSLTKALQTLGYLTAHYVNQFSRTLLLDEDAFIFDALLDAPIDMQFESLYHMFPNAKFIYTTRPLEPWVKSFTRFAQHVFGASDFPTTRERATNPSTLSYRPDLARVMCSMYLNYESPEAAYGAYTERVRTFFNDKPKSKLLEFDIFAGHGWNELCDFLKRPIPEQPFPWINKAGA